MPINVSDFLATIANSKGFSRPNLYRLEMHPPEGLSIDTTNLKGICINCKGATFPGKTLEAQNFASDGYISRLMPFAMTYAPITLTFYLSGDHREKKFFEEWMSMAYNETTNTLNYYDEFVGGLTISQLNRAHKVSKSYQLYEAYPISINEITIGADIENAVSEINVAIAYRKYKDLT